MHPSFSHNIYILSSNIEGKAEHWNLESKSSKVTPISTVRNQIWLYHKQPIEQKWELQRRYLKWVCWIFPDLRLEPKICTKNCKKSAKRAKWNASVQRKRGKELNYYGGLERDCMNIQEGSGGAEGQWVRVFWNWKRGGGEGWGQNCHGREKERSEEMGAQKKQREE